MTQFVLRGKVATSRRPPEHYAYSFFAEQIGEEWITGHAGTVAGFNASFDMYDLQKYVIVVLANYDASAAQRVGKRIRQLLALQ